MEYVCAIRCRKANDPLFIDMLLKRRRNIKTLLQMLNRTEFHINKIGL